VEPQELPRARRIIPDMRRLMLVLMILLLPLRGWMGDAMAMQMLHSAPIASEVIAHSDHFTPGSAGFDSNKAFGSRPDGPSPCPDHLAAPPAHGMHGAHGVHDAHAAHGPQSAALPCPDDGEAATADEAGVHGACNTCQLCHSVALAPGVTLLPTRPLPAGVPSRSTPRFTSAEPLPGFKPPIS
jgi:hypothetical protein